jgi:hypothetical protein
MLTLVAVLMVAAVVGSQTSPVVAEVERDLTGDGRPEVLRLVRDAAPNGEPGLAFTIESAGRSIYRCRVALPWNDSRREGARKELSADAQRLQLSEFSRWFFDDEKFQRPDEFVAGLRRQSISAVDEISDVIARDRGGLDSRTGSLIWHEVRSAPVTIFTFSPGGDTVVALGWSARAGRFYRLLECC